MSSFGGLAHYPGVLERKPGLIEFQVSMRAQPQTSGAILWASWHFNHLYGDRTGSGMAGVTPAADPAARSALLAAASPPDGTARGPVAVSPSFRSGRKSNALAGGEVVRGTLRFILDVNDYPTIVAGVKTLPSDDHMLFVALNQIRPSQPVSGTGFRQVLVKGAVDTNDPVLGPILVVPPAGWWTLSEPTLILSGDAPQLGAGTTMGAAGTFPAPDLDLQVPNPLHLVFPRPTTSLTVRNTEAGGGETLRVSHGLFGQIYAIPPATERTYFGAVKEVCLMSANAAATCAFSLEANINLGGSSGGV